MSGTEANVVDARDIPYACFCMGPQGGECGRVN
jgi:hypothetical protein